MGISVLLDIAGSMIIGGIILLMVGRVNNNVVENTFNNNSEFRTQGSITAIVTTIENDLRKIGASVNYANPYDVSGALVEAANNRIKFCYDINKNGIADTVSYYLGTTSELSSTPNPDDRYLYRQVNSSTPVRLLDGVTFFNLTYYDRKDSIYNNLSTAAARDDIRSIGVILIVEPAESRIGSDQTDSFPPVKWETRITARNLIRSEM